MVFIQFNHNDSHFPDIIIFGYSCKEKNELKNKYTADIALAEKAGHSIENMVLPINQDSDIGTFLEQACGFFYNLSSCPLIVDIWGSTGKAKKAESWKN